MKSKKFTSSFVNAFKGLSVSFRTQFNMRFHFIVAVIVIAFGFFVHLNPLEWCAIILCIGSVISAELLNTSLEVHVDLTTPEQNEKAGRAKDIAAAAVFVVAAMSVLIGLIIFLPKFGLFS